MKRLLLAAFLVVSCSDEKQVLIEPQPVVLKKGASASFVLDPETSSDVMKSGSLVMRVEDITDTETLLSANAKIKLTIGEQKVELSNTIENEILNVEFINRLREEKVYQASKMHIEHVGLTAVGCDVLLLTEIEGQTGVTIEPTICLASQTVPVLKVYLSLFGQKITASFRQSQ